ncbi:DNA repair protein RecO [Castellaniella denitrificans]|jgi:DNA repair protein RecO (recombination protein O)|uniref:DNA repair protein RecO n=1 Tax=Castellaniella denitrificans TaxID=56119 RepID=A0ABT4M1R7_9BURK|nr:DNA repair protein RecO [Castellaniella denitrificans]MCZ4329258.1 DNA repair protein RecO [Castellaniella denitrificans]
MSRRGQRILDARGYVLHASPWRETSLIVQAFTRDHGCVALVAKGAKRPYSALRPVLVGFQPLWLSWTGSTEVRTLTRAESGPVRLLDGRAMMSGWYMNELILRLLAREDPHPGVFDAYEAALDVLAGSRERPHAAVLRRFEWLLLEQAGYGLDAPMPDFEQAGAGPSLRQALRERLDEVLDAPLRTRQVLMELQRY